MKALKLAVIRMAVFKTLTYIEIFFGVVLILPILFCWISLSENKSSIIS